MAKPKRLAVLGHPIAHSRSPAMHTAALDALGLGAEWSYEAIDVDPAEFAERTESLPGQGFVGVNVTIPHKQAALALAGEASAAADEIGAANTLSFDAGGIRADNTDAPGLLASLPEAPAGRRALVLGAGGSARAVVWALAGQGARVEVWNRTAERARELAASVAITSAGAEGSVEAVSDERAGAGGHELIVNCTAVGMGGGRGDPFAALPLVRKRLGRGQVVVDLVYAGEPTPLLAEAADRGAAVVDGLEILVQQGAESLRTWTGGEIRPDVVEAMRRGAADG